MGQAENPPEQYLSGASGSLMNHCYSVLIALITASMNDPVLPLFELTVVLAMKPPLMAVQSHWIHANTLKFSV